MKTQMEENLERWHRVVRDRDVRGLHELLAKRAVFHSPVVHTPQEGREVVAGYLVAAMHVLGNEHFRYVREVASGSDAVLEFVTVVDGIEINGVDMIHWNEAGQIDEFKVMVRPLKAINLVHQMMGAMLARRAE